MKNLLQLSIFLLFLLIFFVTEAQAQDGGPFITNYTVSDESMADNYSMCQDDNGVLVVANRKGLLVFDADEWKIVKTPDLPFVVAFDSISDKVFVGCRNNAGYVRRNKTGDYEFVELALKDPGFIAQILVAQNKVYFISQFAITSVDPANLAVGETVKAKEGESFLFAILMNNEIFLDVEKNGLFKLENDVLKPYLKSFPLSGKIKFSVEYDNKSVLLGASDNKCYIFDGKNLKQMLLQDQQYLQDGNLVDGKALNGDKVAVSTDNSGCMVFDKKSGKTLFTINYDNGLPDDEILAMSTDGDQGIWLAHYDGLTRIDAGIPVKNYTNFKGINGKPQVIEFFNNKLFVGTSNGVYFLTERKNYVEFQPKALAASIPSPSPAAIQSIQMTEAPVESKKTELAVSSQTEKKGLLSRIFRKKKTEEKQVVRVEEEQTDEKEAKTSGIFNFSGSSNPAKEKSADAKKAYRISSVRYEFAKVPGFDIKCRQLVVIDKKLIARSISGIYEITENKAIPILEDVSANYLYYNETEKNLYVCCDDGIKAINYQNQKWNITSFAPEIQGPVYSFAKDVFDNYWIGGESKVIKLKLKANKTIKEKKEFKFENDFREQVIVRISDKKPIFFLSTGIYSIFNDSIQSHRWLSKFTGDESGIHFSNNDFTWVQKKNDWIMLNSTVEADTINYQFLNLFSKLSNIYVDKAQNIWVIENNTSIYKINPGQIASYTTDFTAFVKRFTGATGESLELTDIELESQNNILKILVSAPYFLKPNSNQYQYYIKGITKDWGSWTSSPEFQMTLPSGSWEVKVRARNIFGKISEEKIQKFHIKPPFYLSWWFVLICITALVAAIIQIIKYRERALRHEKEILEVKVKERTRQIEEQKEEIEAQRDDLVDKNIQITAQKEEIEAQKNKITFQNLEITDSIRYAKRLQTAVMPDDAVLKSLLNNYFVLFKPKDIVSGDFFWVKNKHDKIIIAAADCTGHGVPGGFLSMLGVSVLNEISAIDQDFKAHEILNMLRNRVKSTLIKEGQEDQSKDGMDICLMMLDTKSNKAQFAGANNPLYLIRNNGLIEYTADKMPIGAHIVEKESFSLNEFEVLSGDTFYLFSDGYRDQIGGLAEKRIKSVGFKNLLIDIQKYPMKEQKDRLEKFFEEWKGKNEQMDDILVMGVKI